MFGRKILGPFLSLLGAVLGGALGYYAFVWMMEKQGLYGLTLPGAMIGIGCGLLALDRSWMRGVLCALAAFPLGLYCEWRFWPFKADENFLYLVTHAHQLKLMTQIMIVLGALVAFWCGRASALRVLRPERSARTGEPPTNR